MILNNKMVVRYLKLSLIFLMNLKLLFVMMNLKKFDNKKNSFKKSKEKSEEKPNFQTYMTEKILFRKVIKYLNQFLYKK